MAKFVHFKISFGSFLKFYYFCLIYKHSFQNNTFGNKNEKKGLV